MINETEIKILDNMLLRMNITQLVQTMDICEKFIKNETK